MTESRMAVQYTDITAVPEFFDRMGMLDERTPKRVSQFSTR